MITIYGVYTKRGKLLYIGQTSNMVARMSLHRNQPDGKLKAWMDEHGQDVEFRELGSYFDESIAKGVEACMINAMKPPLNDFCKGNAFRSKYVVRPRRGHSKMRD